MHGSENNDGNIVSRASPASYSRRELRVEQRTFRCDRAYGAKQACVISQVWQQQALDCITRHGAGISHDAIDAPGLLIRCPVDITFDLRSEEHTSELQSLMLYTYGHTLSLPYALPNSKTTMGT